MHTTPSQPPPDQVELDNRHWQAIQAAVRAGHPWSEIAAALDDTELGVLLDYLDGITTHVDADDRVAALAVAGIRLDPDGHHIPLTPTGADHR